MDYNENQNHNDGYNPQSDNGPYDYYQQGNSYQQDPNEPPYQQDSYYQQGNPYDRPPYYQQQNNPYMRTPSSQPGYGMAVASMVLGIVSFFVASLITGCLGIIFGAVAKSKGSRSPMATAGIVCGIISVILGIILMIVNRSLFFYFADLFL